MRGITSDDVLWGVLALISAGVLLAFVWAVVDTWWTYREPRVDRQPSRFPLARGIRWPRR